MPEKISILIKEQKEYFTSQQTKKISFRIEQLKKLKQAILAYEEKLNKALHQDLHKSKTESYTMEIGIVLEELSYAIKNLKKWAKPKKQPGSLLWPLAKNYITYEPYGVSLIISPWNYPVQLCLAPLIGSMEAGNCTVIKPSEISVNTSRVIKEMLDEYFSNDYIAVIEGGVDVSTELLKQKFDYILYTGGEVVGKIVMKAAAENLIPLTLELGGKSPCIIDKEIDINKAVSRITWGKFLNCGQTCIAPDYLLVHKDVKDKVIAGIKDKIKQYYGDDAKLSDDYGRIINNKHFLRLTNYLKEVEIISGGKSDEENLYIEPTLVKGESNSLIMQEEIFGPILPVIEYEGLNEIIEFINARPKPLALYVFSKNEQVVNRVLNETSSGGACVNDVIIHVSSLHLPFGGVGISGFGKYHGQASFKTFSNLKSVMKQTWLFDLPLRYPPKINKFLGLIKKIVK